MENEIVPHDINHAADLAAFMNVDKRLQDPTQRRDYLSQLDGNDFIDLTQQVASIVRTGDANAKQHFDGETVSIAGRQVPHQPDKEGLIRETWQVAKDFLNDPKLSDQDALDYAALTVAGGLLYAHPFADGNGRTTRGLSYMISQGSTKAEEQLPEIFANSLGGNQWKVGPRLIADLPESKFKGDQPNVIEWEDTLAGDADDAMGGIIANSLPGYGNRILRKVLEDPDETVVQYAKKNTTTDSSGRTTLNAEAFIEDLVNDPNMGMANAQKLLRLEREGRADFIRRYLSAMKSNALWDAKGLISGMRNQVEGNTMASTALEAELEKRAQGAAMKPRDQQLVQHIGVSAIRYQ